MYSSCNLLYSLYQQKQRTIHYPATNQEFIFLKRKSVIPHFHILLSFYTFLNIFFIIKFTITYLLPFIHKKISKTPCQLCADKGSKLNHIIILFFLSEHQIKCCHSGIYHKHYDYAYVHLVACGYLIILVGIICICHLCFWCIYRSRCILLFIIGFQVNLQESLFLLFFLPYFTLPSPIYYRLILIIISGYLYVDITL